MLLKSSIIITVVFLKSIIFPATVNKNLNSFVGVWEYRQENSGSKSGYDSEGEKIEFKLENNQLSGTYFGVEREGEHGIFYSVVKLKNIIFTEDNKINFIVPERDLFSKRPKNINEATKNKENNNGFTRSTLQYSGTIRNDVLWLVCKTDYGNCPADSLDFYKDKWK